MADRRADDWNGSEVAIVGMAGRFPGARDLEALWANLCGGVESIRVLDSAEIEPSALGELPLDSPQYVPAAALLDDVELFDARFFGYSPHEAEMIDPQQRLLLECAWEALERTGYNPESYPGAIGVFAGARTNTYLFNLFSNRAAMAAADPFQVGLGNDLAFLASRISYRLNLRGPSYAVHTACSTGLVAVHLARQSLLLDECQMALAAGVAINVPQKTGYLYQPGAVSSPDGHTRAFDAEARGTVFGSGLGVVVLKRLEDARRDGDRIHAVLRGSATNNDGARKASFTAPSVHGQSDVILDALADAGVAAETLGYVEAHGTGTQLGDPIEVRALTRAFAASTARRGFCALGSVKTNLGHLDAAAGIVSLLKATLALERRQIPPSLHYHSPNPQIDFAQTPFYVNDRLADWPAGAAPRRAAVSSFGIGGTNAHVILEEAPAPEPPRPAGPWQPLLLSARSEAALEQVTARLAEHLRRHPELELADVAFTLLAGRKRFDHRRAAVCRDLEDAVETLTRRDSARVHDQALEEGDRPLAFVFTGQGGEIAGAGAGLYRSEPVFRAEIDRCAELASAGLGCDLRELLLADGLDIAARLRRTDLAQPALCALELALARLLESWGVRPAAVLGHSVGELAAAAVAGVLSPQDALAVAVERGRLMQACAPGAMTTASLPAAEIEALLDPAGELAVAALNAPDLTVVSGPETAVAELEGQLREHGIEHRRLHTAHAFHSELMAPVVRPLTERMAGLALAPPAIPWVSTLTGDWVSPEEARDPAYWGRQLREPVRFADALSVLLTDPAWVFLEIGPGTALTRLLRRHPLCSRERVVVPALPVRTAEDQRRELLLSLGRLWTAGVELDGGLLFGEGRRRVPLPTYPFERERFWIEAMEAPASAATARGKRADLAGWFHVPAWSRSLPPAALASEPASAGEVCLALLDETGDETGLGPRLAAALEGAGHRLVRVAAGERFERRGADSYALDPGSSADYDALFAALRSEGLAVRRIVHLFSLGPATAGEGHAFERAQRRGYYSLLFAAQALLRGDAGERPVRIVVLTAGLQEVAAGDGVQPEAATVLGPCRVLPQEFPQLSCLPVDVDLPAPGSPEEAALLDGLLREIAGEGSELAVAYRAGRRFVQDLQPLPIEAAEAPPRPLRERGVYLITGGLGGVGLLLAERLAAGHQARLVLTARTPLPPHEEWGRRIAAAAEGDPLAARLRRLAAIEAAGGEVVTAAVDAFDELAMRRLIDDAEARFGRLDGVIHAAGVTSGSSLYRSAIEIGAEESAAQFRPKAHGLYVLERVLAGRAPDFVVLLSSNAASLGGLGYIAYSAANAFMDAFAASRARTAPFPWLSTGWDPWPEDTKVHGVETGLDRYAMNRDEGFEAFRRAVTSGLDGMVAIATGDLELRLDRWVRRREAVAATAQTHARPALRSRFVAPQTEQERAIAAIWQEVLGIEQVGVTDSFFDLGGHSLLATRLVARLRERLQVDLSLQTFFAAPTVLGIAGALAAGDGAGEADEARDILRQLQELSEAEALAELSRLSPEPHE